MYYINISHKEFLYDLSVFKLNSTGRVRRDIQGLFDMIGNFFKADESGKSPASSMMKSVLGAMSNMGPKSPS